MTSDKLDYVITKLGRWEEAAVRLLPRGKGVWVGIKAKGYTLSIDHRVVANVRRIRPGVWRGRIEGFEWLITADMPAARFQQIPGGKSMTHTPVKGFSSSKEAKKEIEAILHSLPAKS